MTDPGGETVVDDLVCELLCAVQVAGEESAGTKRYSAPVGAHRVAEVCEQLERLLVTPNRIRPNVLVCRDPGLRGMPQPGKRHRLAGWD